MHRDNTYLLKFQWDSLTFRPTYNLFIDWLLYIRALEGYCEITVSLNMHAWNWNLLERQLIRFSGATILRYFDIGTCQGVSTEAWVPLAWQSLPPNAYSSSSLMALQSSVDLHLLNGLLSVSSVFWPLFPVCNFAMINVCLSTIVYVHGYNNYLLWK
jgi:hypothetical protein